MIKRGIIKDKTSNNLLTLVKDILTPIFCTAFLNNAGSPDRKDIAGNIDTDAISDQLSSIDTSGLSNALGNFGGFG